ncbi:MAG: outer membrane protein assembly factor BamD [Candidatus Binatus sp.]|uniref:tetratricopeptide repeat protein n=1 Tax=Candidatus Binatus sp. TaxID=2811406 RepID=UPI00271ADF3F|nr:outer membrane protein assembly factor BamD [Candidatus Binatus sp.]MDO8433689.1 outer membrane protein assembly factor BamD [Candidatus Binatus sp.]
MNDQVLTIKQGNADAEGESSSPSSNNKRIAELESEVKSLRAGIAASPGVNPPPADELASTEPETAPPPASGLPPSGYSAPRPAPAEPASTWQQELDQEIDQAKASSEPGVKLYRSGLDAMKAGKYPLAVTIFTKLQHSFPKSALSEPAEYFAANALYETGKYDQAILQFNDLVMRYPKGRFASAALLREAEAFLKLNDRIDARLTLQKLVADHAGTPQATGANTMMKDLASD